MYVVHCGFDRNGRPRNRLFADEPQAVAFCSRWFDRTGIVLSIVKQ